MKGSDHPESIRKASEFNGFLKVEDVFVWQTRRGRAAHKERMLRHDAAWHVQQTANNMTRMGITTDGILGEEVAGRGVF